MTTYTDPIICTRIGAIQHGIDGTDEYYKVVFNPRTTQEELQKELNRRYSYSSSYPGGTFCHYVILYYSKVDVFSVTMKVPHRYDN